jgi:DNA-binding MarR family transcriptional regulator
MKTPKSTDSSPEGPGTGPSLEGPKTGAQGPTPNRPNPEGVQSKDMEIATNLRITINRLVKIMRRETRNDGQLSLTERSTLGLLYPDIQLAPTDIARTEKVTTQSMSQVVNHLVELNYVARAPSAEDGRKTLLSLTDAGRSRVELARQEKQEWLAKSVHEKVAEAEKDLLLQAIQILTKLVDE